MSKKFYVIVAQALRQGIASLDPAQRNAVVVSFMFTLANIPGFDPEKFRKAVLD